MRELLDACLPHRLRRELAPHDVQTAKFAGLDGLIDGDLLNAIAGKFDVLVTVASSQPSQQYLRGRPVAIVLLRAPSNRLPDLLALVPEILKAIDDIDSGETREVRRQPR